jgi:hypothetical protein
VNAVRLSEGIVDTLSEAPKPSPGDAGGANGELVASEAGDGILGARRRPQAVGHGEEDLITGIVSVGVVNRFELVEVDIEHANIADRLSARSQSERLCELLAKEQPIS